MDRVGSHKVSRTPIPHVGGDYEKVSACMRVGDPVATSGLA